MIPLYEVTVQATIKVNAYDEERAMDLAELSDASEFDFDWSSVEVKEVQT